MKVGIYGGTFNPPHIGHVLSVMSAASQLDLDVLVIVPAGIPPHKTLPAGTPPADLRHFLTMNAFWNVERTIVSNIEVNNPGPSYTADTVMTLKQIYPDADLFLLIGTDMFLTLEYWKNFEKLIRTVTPAVFSRSTNERKKIKNYAKRLQERHGVVTKTVINKAVQISSSELREMLTKREGVRYINDTNYSYIIKNRLYGAKPDWDWLRARAHSMLVPARIPHVTGCEEEALSLAKRWSVNSDDAREAAILHDITKRLNVYDHLRILEDCNITIGKLEFAEEKLLHAKTGAVLAKNVFGVSDEVADAIMWHTTGRAGMSMLEKVIYLADYIEPNRDFPGVDKLRELAYKNINSAMRFGLEMTIEDIVSRGITPNHTTIDALNDVNIRQEQR